MIEILQEHSRKARKLHTCDFCGQTIQKGEIYNWQKLICDGEIYEWKCHKKCDYIASRLREECFVDQDAIDDGITEDDFKEGCIECCKRFICPNCERADKTCDDVECVDGESYCLDKIYDFLKSTERCAKED